MHRNLVSWAFVVMLLGVALAVGCGGGGGGGGGGGSPVGPVVAPEGGRADLRGIVTLEGVPVPQAMVYLLREASSTEELTRRANVLNTVGADLSQLTADGNGYRTQTNAQGEYFFSQIPVGNYILYAMANPNTQISQPVVVGAITNLDLALRPTGAISGKIVDTSGTQVVPKVGFIVYLQGTSYIGVTGLDGSFVILNVPISSMPYTLLPQAASSYAFKNQPVYVLVSAGGNTSVGTIEVIPARGTITGFAYLPGVADHSGIAVTVDGGNSGVTDASGAFTLTNVTFGVRTVSYTRSFNGEPYSARQTVTVESLATTLAPPVTLAPDSQTKARIEVNMAGLIGGPAYVQWELWRAGETYPQHTGSNNGNATYTYFGKEPGTWGVRVYPGTEYILVNAAPGSPNQIASQTVVAGGNASFSIRLQYARGAIIGQATLLNTLFPTTYPDLQVRLMPGNLAPSMPFNAVGSFSFTNLATGTYSIVVSGSGYTASQPITVVPGQNPVSVPLTSTFPIVNAIATDANTCTLTGARFDVTTGGGRVRITSGANVYTRAPGTFLPDTYSVAISDLPPGQYTATVVNGDGAVATNSQLFWRPFLTTPSIYSSTVGSTTITIYWSGPSEGGADSYAVFLNGSQVSSGLTANSFTFTGLNPNTNYSVAVAAFNDSLGLFSAQSPVQMIRTKPVYTTPIKVDTGLAMNGFKGASYKNGVLYAIGTDAGNNTRLYRYDFATGASASAIITPPNDAVISSIQATANYVYVGYASAVPRLIVQQFHPLSLSQIGTDLLISGFDSGGPPELRFLERPTGGLYMVTWGIQGGYQVASFSRLYESPLSIGPELDITAKLPGTPLDATFLRVGGSEYVALTGSNESGYFFRVYDAAFAALQQDFTFQGMPSYLTSQFNDNGWALARNATVHLSKVGTLIPGTSFNFPDLKQLVLDSQNRLYGLCFSGTFMTLARFSATGALRDTTDFVNPFQPTLPQKGIFYDVDRDQVVVVTGMNGNFGLTLFSTAD